MATQYFYKVSVQYTIIGEVPGYLTLADNDETAPMSAVPYILRDVTRVKAHGNQVIGQLFESATGASRFEISDIAYTVSKVTPLIKNVTNESSQKGVETSCPHTWLHVYDEVRMLVNRETGEAKEVARKRAAHRVRSCAKCGSTQRGVTLHRK